MRIIFILARRINSCSMIVNFYFSSSSCSKCIMLNWVVLFMCTKISLKSVIILVDSRHVAWEVILWSHPAIIYVPYSDNEIMIMMIVIMIMKSRIAWTNWSFTKSLLLKGLWTTSLTEVSLQYLVLSNNYFISLYLLCEYPYSSLFTMVFIVCVLP